MATEEPKTPLHLKDLREIMAAGFNLKGTPNAKPYLHIAPGYQVVDGEKYLQFPVRKRGAAVLSDLPSLIDYVNGNKNATTRAFCAQNGQITVYFDGHGETTAGWFEHSASFTPVGDPLWMRWRAINNDPQSQGDLVEFLERNFQCIVDPPGASVLELAEHLSAHVDARYESKVGNVDGKTKLLFEEDVEVRGSKSTTRGEMMLPRSMVVALPIFKGGEVQQYKWRMKAVVHERQIRFVIDLPTLQEEVDKAVLALQTEFVTKTEVKLFQGAFTPVKL